MGNERCAQKETPPFRMALARRCYLRGGYPNTLYRESVIWAEAILKKPRTTPQATGGILNGSRIAIKRVRDIFYGHGCSFASYYIHRRVQPLFWHEGSEVPTFLLAGSGGFEPVSPQARPNATGREVLHGANRRASAGRFICEDGNAKGQETPPDNLSRCITHSSPSEHLRGPLSCQADHLSQVPEPVVQARGEDDRCQHRNGAYPGCLRRRFRYGDHNLRRLRPYAAYQSREKQVPGEADRYGFPPETPCFTARAGRDSLLYHRPGSICQESVATAGPITQWPFAPSSRLLAMTSGPRAQSRANQRAQEALGYGE